MNKFLSAYFKNKKPDEHICIVIKRDDALEHGYFTEVSKAALFAERGNKNHDVYYGLSTYREDAGDYERDQTLISSPYPWCVLDFDFKDQLNIQRLTPAQLHTAIHREIWQRHRCTYWHNFTGAGTHLYIRCRDYAQAMVLRQAFEAKYPKGNEHGIVVDHRPAKALNAIMRLPNSFHHKANKQGVIKPVQNRFVVEDNTSVKGLKYDRNKTYKPLTTTNKLPPFLQYGSSVSSRYSQALNRSDRVPYDEMIDTCAAFKAFEKSTEGGHDACVAYLQSLHHVKGIDNFAHGEKIWAMKQFKSPESYSAQYHSVQGIENCSNRWQQSGYVKHCEGCAYQTDNRNPVVIVRNKINSGALVEAPAVEQEDAEDDEEGELILPNPNNSNQHFSIYQNKVFVIQENNSEEIRRELLEHQHLVEFTGETTTQSFNNKTDWPHLVFRLGDEVETIPMAVTSGEARKYLIGAKFVIREQTIKYAIGKGRSKVSAFKESLYDFFTALANTHPNIATTRMGWAPDLSRFGAPWGTLLPGCDYLQPPISRFAKKHADTQQADQWWAAIKPYLFTNEHMWAHAQMVINGFAGGLVGILGRKYPYGTLSIYGSGNVGKTLSLDIARSIWGNYPYIRGADTEQAANYKLAQGYDLFTGVDDYKAANRDRKNSASNTVDAGALLHRFTEGEGRARLNRESQLMEVDTFRGSMGITANLSIKQDLQEMGTSMASHAAAKRVVEHLVVDVTQAFPDVAVLSQYVKIAIERYAGSAGREWVEYLMERREDLRNFSDNIWLTYCSDPVVVQSRFYADYFHSLYITRRVLEKMGRLDGIPKHLLDQIAPGPELIPDAIREQEKLTILQSLANVPSLAAIAADAVQMYSLTDKRRQLKSWQVLRKQQFASKILPDVFKLINPDKTTSTGFDPTTANSDVSKNWPQTAILPLRQHQKDALYILFFTKAGLKKVAKDFALQDIDVLIEEWGLREFSIKKGSKFGLPLSTTNHPHYTGKIYWTPVT